MDDANDVVAQVDKGWVEFTHVQQGFGIAPRSSNNSYGLARKDQADEILARLWDKSRE